MSSGSYSIGCARVENLMEVLLLGYDFACFGTMKGLKARIVAHQEQEEAEEVFCEDYIGCVSERSGLTFRLTTQTKDSSFFRMK